MVQGTRSFQKRSKLTQVRSVTKTDARGPFSWGIAIALLGLLASGAHAQTTPRPEAAGNKRMAQEQRRDWVRAQLSKLVSDERERDEMLTRLKKLSDDQVQELATLCLDELEARRKRQFAALREANTREADNLREANSREQAFREQLARQFSPQLSPPPFFFGRPVGYFPVITWLPEGASLSAQAIVTPDGRHVRMSVAPFFSTIGPVYTFNYMTGETRRYDR